MRPHGSRGSVFPAYWVLAGTFLCLLTQPLRAAKAPLQTPAGTFALTMEDGLTASRHLRRLSDAEKAFHSITGFSQESFPPIQIVVHNSISTRFSKPSLQVDALEGGVPRIRLDLPDRDDPLAGQYLATALLLREYFGSTAPAPGSPLPVYPEWITRGLSPLLLSPGSLLSSSPSFLAKGSTPSLEGFLVEKVPPIENRTLLDRYDALSASLVKAAFAGTGGAAAFRTWVGRVDATADDKSIPPWIPGWEMRPVERRWILLLAGSSAASEGVAVIPTADAALHEYREIMDPVLHAGLFASLRGKGGAFVATRLSERLSALRLKSNPLVIPLLDRTILLLGCSGKLSEKKMLMEEKSIISLITETESRTRSIGDYLDWYEAAQVPVKSGIFDHLADPSSTTVRKGPVGRYLDAVEARGW